jgi:hypothetical protein
MVGDGVFLVLLALWAGVMGLVDQKALWWRFQARRFSDRRRTSRRRRGIGRGEPV